MELVNNIESLWLYNESNILAKTENQKLYSINVENHVKRNIYSKTNDEQLMQSDINWYSGTFITRRSSDVENRYIYRFHDADKTFDIVIDKKVNKVNYLKTVKAICFKVESNIDNDSVSLFTDMNGKSIKVLNNYVGRGGDYPLEIISCSAEEKLAIIGYSSIVNPDKKPYILCIDEKHNIQWEQTLTQGWSIYDIQSTYNNLAIISLHSIKGGTKVLLCSVDKGEIIHTFQYNDRMFQKVKISPSGMWTLIYGGNHVAVINTNTKEEKWKYDLLKMGYNIDDAVINNEGKAFLIYSAIEDNEPTLLVSVNDKITPETIWESPNTTDYEKSIKSNSIILLKDNVILFRYGKYIMKLITDKELGK